MYQITIPEIEKVWMDIKLDGLIPTIDELVLRLKAMEEQFLDERDIYEIKKKESVEREVDQAVYEHQASNIPEGFDNEGSSTAGSFN